MSNRVYLNHRIQAMADAIALALYGGQFSEARRTIARDTAIKAFWEWNPDELKASLATESDDSRAPVGGTDPVPDATGDTGQLPDPNDEESGDLAEGIIICPECGGPNGAHMIDCGLWEVNKIERGLRRMIQTEVRK